MSLLVTQASWPARLNQSTQIPMATPVTEEKVLYLLDPKRRDMSLPWKPAPPWMVKGGAGFSLCIRAKLGDSSWEDSAA